MSTLPEGTKNPWHELGNLWIIADYYQVGDLLELLERQISSNLTNDNAAECLFFADHFNCKALQKYVSKFIMHSPSVKKQVMQSEFVDKLSKGALKVMLSHDL